MEKWKAGLKKYGFLVILFLGILVCLIKKDNYLDVPVISNPQSQLRFATEDIVLEQTWQPHIKKIAGIKIPYTAQEDFHANLSLQLLSDDGAVVLQEAGLQKEFTKDERGSLVFEFKPIKVQPGERIRIQLFFAEGTEKGSLLIDSDEDYMGCSIGEEAVEAGAAFTIVFVKSSRIFWLFAALFPLLAFTFLGMMLWNRKWEEVVGLSLICVVAVLYAVGWIEQLELGVWIVFALAAIALLLAVFLYLKKGHDISSLLSPGLFVWGIIFLLILVGTHGAWLARADEYTHWGLAVKDMFFYDSFGKHFNTTVKLPRYMPFSTLIEYFFVYTNGMFAEDIVYVGFLTSLLSVMVLVCRPAQKKLCYLWPLLATMIFVPLIFFQDVSNCIYVDPMLAVFAAYAFICYFGEERSVFNWLRIAGAMFGLVMTKDIGVIIAGLLAVVMIADVLWQQIRMKKLEIKQLVMPVCCLVLVVVFFFSWQIYMGIPVKVPEDYVATQQPAQEFADTLSASKLSVSGIINVLTGNGESYQYKTMKNLLSTLFDGETYRLGNLGVSYMDIAIVVLWITSILVYFKWFRKENEKMLSFGIFSFIAGLGYCACLGILYIFAFSPEEAFGLASHERYLASYLCAVVVAFLYLVCKRLAESQEEEKKKSFLVAICISVCLLLWVPVKHFVWTNMDINISKDMKYGFEEMEEVLRSFSDKAENVYFICSNSDGGSRNMFQNSACPLLIPYKEGNLAASAEAIEMQKLLYKEQGIDMKEKTLLSTDEWAERLQVCDYVFVLHADEAFRSDYAGLFEEPETIKMGAFYQVNKADSEVKLHHIGTVSVLTYY